MDDMDFDEIFAKLQSGESDQVEAKLAKARVGKSVLETISAFSNEPGLGYGYILLGIEERSGAFFVVGIEDPEKIQNQIATLCSSSFSVELRPQIRIFPEHNNAIVVKISEAPRQDKPVYIKSKGMVNGSFRRIGASDQLCVRGDFKHLYHLGLSYEYEEDLLKVC